MKPSELSLRLNRKADRIPVEFAKAQANIGKAAIAIAQKWSSGTKTTAQLRAEGHPYSTRYANAAQSGLINNQADTFFSGWYYDPIRKKLGNRDPVFRFLQEGTWKMHARDILGAIKRDLAPVMRQEVRLAVKRSLKS